MKKNAILVGDEEVIFLLLEAMLKPEYSFGLIVDGFPRTMVQVQCLKLLQARLLQLWQDYMDTPFASNFHRPMFRVVVLYVDEEESVKRQLARGQSVKQYNKLVETSGEGEVVENRATDDSIELARQRYQTFRVESYEPLRTLREYFHYHFIPANASKEIVAQRVYEEFKYQSTLDLHDDTYQSVSVLPTASDISLFYRQTLVRNLDTYQVWCGVCVWLSPLTPPDPALRPLPVRHCPCPRRLPATAQALFQCGCCGGQDF
jgi:adenylate kinase